MADTTITLIVGAYFGWLALYVVAVVLDLGIVRRKRR